MTIGKITANAVLRDQCDGTEVPVREGQLIEVVALAVGGTAQTLVKEAGHLCRLPSESLLSVCR